MDGLIFACKFEKVGVCNSPILKNVSERVMLQVGFDPRSFHSFGGEFWGFAGGN